MTATATAKPKTTTARSRKPLPDTSTPSSTSAVDALAENPSHQVPTYADPRDLVIADNVRKRVVLDDDFVETIRQYGVLEPVIVFEHAGKYHVLIGQRRTLGAVKAERDLIPIRVIDPTDPATSAILQLIENDHRAPMTASEHVAAFHQLELAGLSVDEISEKTRTPVARVSAALKIANGAAAKILDSLPVTFEQAAALATLQDYPEQLKDVVDVVAGRPEQIDHALVRARRFVAVRDALAEEVRLAEELGYKVVVVPDGEYIAPELRSQYNATKDLARLDFLIDEAGEAVAFDKRGFPLPGELSDEAKANITLYLSADEEFDDDLETYVPNVEGAWALKGWPSFGYRLSDSYCQRRLFREASATTSPAPKAAKELSAEQQKVKDAETAKRRAVIANNRAWSAATEVRRAWIEDFLSGTEEPAGWAEHCAVALAGAYFTFEPHTALRMLGIAESVHSGALGKEAAKKGRGSWVILALVLARVEQQQEFAKSGWRNHHAQDHLKQLSAWGYTLSEIEEQVVKGTVKGR